MAVVDPDLERPTFVIHGSATGDSLLDAIRALHAQCMPDLTSTSPTDIDWSALLEPSDSSDFPVAAPQVPDTLELPLMLQTTDALEALMKKAAGQLH